MLHIIIFDGSFKTTPFINRLVKGLAGNHQVYILGFNEKLSRKIDGVNYVSLGSNQNKLRFAVTTFGRLIRARKVNLVLPTFKKLLQGDRRALQEQNLELALQAIAPDIIHLQWPSVLPWFETVLLEQKIPVVLSQRGYHSNVRPFVDGQNYDYLKEWYPKMAGFHSVSKAISANGDKIWNAPNKIDKVVYTGLDLQEVHFLSQYSRANPLQLLSVGRAHWIKGYDYALQSCKLLHEKGIPFQYTIIGGAGDEELQFLIANLGLTGHVFLEERIAQQTVIKKMHEASLLLMPSLEEGIPNVVVEAMAIGLPVISTDCGGIPELITDRKGGWVVPMRNPEAMAAAIETFSGLPIEKIMEVRTAARAKVEKQHSAEGMVQGMEGLYYRVLGGAKNPLSAGGRHLYFGFAQHRLFWKGGSFLSLNIFVYNFPKITSQNVS